MTAAAVHTFDVERARRETPGCENVVHLNNAGAALMPTPVLDRTVTHLKLEARVGGYEAAALVAEEIEDVYGSAARLLGCRTDEIAVVDSATRAWDMAFYSVPFRPGDRILTSEAEYASNFIAYLQLAQRYNLRVDVVPNGESGQISVPRLRDLIDERVRLISLTHVPTNGGLVNPAAEVGKVARDAGVLYLLDACQSAGQMSLDVDEIGCDMVSMTGRKYLRGPRGTGLLYVRREVLDELAPPMLDLHAATWVVPDTSRCPAFRVVGVQLRGQTRPWRGDRLRSRVGTGPHPRARIRAGRRAPAEPGSVTPSHSSRRGRRTVRDRVLHGRRRRASRRASRARRTRDQRQCVQNPLDETGHGESRARGARARVGALLQHLRGARDALRRSTRHRPPALAGL